MKAQVKDSTHLAEPQRSGDEPAVYFDVLCFVLLTAPSSGVVNVYDEPYFPDSTFSSKRDVEDLTVKWYTKQLRAMDEPSLWKLSERERTATVYRFIWMPTFHPAVSVRVSEIGDGAELKFVRLDGRGGYEPGKASIRKSVKLTKDQWEEFRRLLRRVNLKEMPTKDDEKFGDDGSQLIVEAVNKGQYHIVDRFSPERGPYYDLCRFVLLDLSGLKINDVWGEYFAADGKR